MQHSAIECSSILNPQNGMIFYSWHYSINSLDWSSHSFDLVDHCSNQLIFFSSKLQQKRTNFCISSIQHRGTKQLWQVNMKMEGYQAFFSCTQCGHQYKSFNMEKRCGRGCPKCGALNAPYKEVCIWCANSSFMSIFLEKMNKILSAFVFFSHTSKIGNLFRTDIDPKIWKW